MFPLRKQVPYYQQEQLQFEVQPTRQDVTVLNDSVVLSVSMSIYLGGTFVIGTYLN